MSRYSPGNVLMVGLTVPIRIKRRGLRKTFILPDGNSLQYRPWDPEPTPLPLALARGLAISVPVIP